MDPILIAIAGALAKEAVSGGAKALGKLVQLVKDKFRHDVGAEVVLASAQENPDDPKWVDALAKVLHATGERDPAFAAELRAMWAQSTTDVTSTEVRQTASYGKVTNKIDKNVYGNVVQAGNIGGDVNMH